MKITDEFTYKSPFGYEYPNCHFRCNRYSYNGNLYLSIVNDIDGPICTCSVNTDEKLDDDRIAIKNYSENEEMDSFLVELGILDKLVNHIPSGFVKIPVYTLTQSGKELFEGII